MCFFSQRNYKVTIMLEVVKELHSESKGDYDVLSKLIDKKMKPKGGDKIKLAEIPTLRELRKDMLSCINLVSSFWNEKRKVLEPCCGKGGFIIDVYCRLMTGLEGIIPDEVDRRRIILEECIYFADINANNVEICKLLLDPNDEYKLNYYIGDTLTLNVKDIWNIDGFDLVFGNPPFNGQSGTGTGTPIWHKFVKVSLESWLKVGGHLLFVHPSGWRKPCYSRSQFSGLFELMTHKNHMKYVSIHSVKDGKKAFSCSTRYDYYLIQRTNAKHELLTSVRDEMCVEKTYSMYNLKWFPNKNIDGILEVTSKEGNKCKVFCDSKYHAVNKTNISDICDDVYKYPLIHSTPKSGVRYKYSKHNDRGHFGVSKIIFGESGINHVVVDMDGKYGLTQGAIGIVVSDIEQANNIKNALMSAKFQELLSGTIFGNYRIDWRLFTDINEDFYESFN